nr:hypothetical protein CKG001_12800 [Bdellovibrio sp. CKG001]BFD62550.1 hypothetical protein BdHM001_12310 [Bdellovibrio sp. HM001]BFD67545.1 hypothetical protein HAGR004_25670 [Bdellovibrio sp. HAGR004]
MKEDRYKIVNGVQIIEVRVKDLQQLFDYRDPAPFRQRDLDEEFAKYLESYLDEISPNRPLQIHIHIESATDVVSHDDIKESIHDYFHYQIQLKRGQLSKTYRTAQIFLGIGLVLVAACLTIAHAISTMKPGPVSGAVREGFVIFGWVSLWRPIDLILFDWYPIYDRIRIYRRLASAEMEVTMGKKYS